MGSASWIAVDWGTSHLRAWAIDDRGRVLARAGSGDGMGKLNPEGFEAALMSVIEGWLYDRPVDVFVCGMAGSRQGWKEAPYRAVPCTPIDDRFVSVATGDPRLDVRIISGLRQNEPADVIRGEETQIAGYLAGNPGFDGILCLPGTHSKWVHVSAGEVVSFRTCMTGELFDLLANASVLRHTVQTDDWDGEHFEDGIATTLSRPERLASELFSVRASDLLHGSGPVAGRSRLSGLLLGAELAATRPYWLGQAVAIVGADQLAQIYRAALETQGLQVAVADGEDMTIAGLAAARDALNLQSA